MSPTVPDRMVRRQTRGPTHTWLNTRRRGLALCHHWAVQCGEDAAPKREENDGKEPKNRQTSEQRQRRRTITAKGREEMTTKFETHCGKQGCICDHRVSCYKGWRDTDGPTSPCQVCRPDTHRRWVDTLDARSKGLPLPVIAKIWSGVYAR